MVTVWFSSTPAPGSMLLESASLQVAPGERVCIVGRNGEDKSSMLRLAMAAAAAGLRRGVAAAGARLAVMEQDIVAVRQATVWEVVEGGLAGDTHLEDWEIPTRVATVLSQLGLDGDARYEDLSGGWRRAPAGSRAGAGSELLLLDEPTQSSGHPGHRMAGGDLLRHSAARFCSSATTGASSTASPRASWIWTAAGCPAGPATTATTPRRRPRSWRTRAKANALFDKRLARGRCGSARALRRAAPATKAACAR